MKKLESKVQEEIIKYLKGLPNLYFEKTVITNRRGSPDIKICYKGKFIALEVKTDKGEVSELQRYYLERIRAAGGIGEVVRSVQDVKNVICGVC